MSHSLRLYTLCLFLPLIPRLSDSCFCAAKLTAPRLLLGREEKKSEINKHFASEGYSVFWYEVLKKNALDAASIQRERV